MQFLAFDVLAGPQQYCVCIEAIIYSQLKIAMAASKFIPPAYYIY
jgi:hypothetical protein